MKTPVRIAFEDFWHEATPAAIRENPLFKLLSRRFDLKLSSNPDFLVYSTFGRRHLKYNCTRIFYTGENVRPDFERCDYAFSFDYPTNEQNFRLPLYKLYGGLEELSNMNRSRANPSALKFCNFLYSNNKASERIRFLDCLETYKPVDSGGRVRNNLGYRIADKHEFLAGYKFTIAFENSSHPGYSTEKLLEALAARTVPIYWGNPLVDRDFNTDCFINCHSFDSFEDVVEHVREVDQNDELFQAYLNAPVFSNGSDNEFIRDANIFERFDSIFSDTNKRSGYSSDGIKYWLGGANIADQVRRMLKRLRS